MSRTVTDEQNVRAMSDPPTQASPCFTQEAHWSKTVLPNLFTTHLH
jgi:hypothetical protein